MADRNKRILIVAKGHPDFNGGDGEIAAYSLYQELSVREECTTLFVAWHDMGSIAHVGTPFATRDGKRKEILFYSRRNDSFLFSQPDKYVIWACFRELLEWYKPHVVHFYHYIHLGIEMIREVRNYSDRTAIILTLFDYSAICHRNGQMLKTQNDQLCHQSTPIDCHQCFPEKSPDEFWLRARYLKSFFKLIDAFIAPSQFLIERYTDWGIPRGKIVLIENGYPIERGAIDKERTSKESKVIFAFFGQLSKHNGLHVLLDALDSVPKSIRKCISVSIYGSGLSSQPKAFQKYCRNRFSSKTIRFHGAYRREELKELISDIDWVVVPSIWWESAPMMIQSAFMYGRPVICSGIGAMAEKTEDGKNGLHFRVGDPVDLAARISDAVTDPSLWEKLANSIQPPPNIRDTADQHLKQYGAIVI